MRGKVWRLTVGAARGLGMVLWYGGLWWVCLKVVGIGIVLVYAVVEGVGMWWRG
jgi:hypothetical protein